MASNYYRRPAPPFPTCHANTRETSRSWSRWQCSRRCSQQCRFEARPELLLLHQLLRLLSAAPKRRAPRAAASSGPDDAERVFGSRRLLMRFSLVSLLFFGCVSVAFAQAVLRVG